MKLPLSALLLLFVSTLSAQISYTWNGSSSTAWNTSTNWTPNGLPGAADNVTIVTGSNNCVLNTGASITNITVSSGTFNLGGFTLTATGNAVFTAGTVTNGTLTVNAGTGATATLTNTSFSASSALNITTGAITINGGTYDGNVSLNQTGATQTTGTGGAIFNGNLSLTNSGSSNLRINGNCTYNGATTLNNTGTGYLLPELTTGSTYNGNLILNNSSASQNLRMAYLGNTSFNGNISVNYTGGGTSGIIFCEQATATATLANTKTISAGGGGFAAGNLTLQHFTQTGSTAQNLSLTGTATVNISLSSVFNGNLSVTSPNFYLSNSTFNGTTTLTKTDGTTSNANSGGNTFNGTLTVNYTSASGTGYLSFANGTRDIYNGDVYSNNNSLDRVIFGHNSTNNQFNGNLYMSQAGSSVGTSTVWNGGSTCIFAAGKTPQIGAGGFSTGWLYLQGITQSAADNINLTLTGTSYITVGNGSAANPCTFSGSLTITSPDIYLRGSTYNGPVTVTKTGGVDNHNNGGLNIFNSTFTVNQQSTTGYFMVGYNSNDQFNDNITVSNTGTRGISLGWSSGTGAPVLAAGKTILMGGAGFTGGWLQLGSFTYNAGVPLSLTFTGSAAFYVTNSSTPCLFQDAVNVTSPDLYIQGGIFNGATTFTKTGGIDNHNSGRQNIFNSTLAVNQQSTTGYFMLGYNSNDQFNGDITVTNTGTRGISFGWSGGTGTPTLAPGKTILIGGAGFSGGWLQLGSFTQNGTTTGINITLTGSSAFYVVNTPNPCLFNAPLSVTAPDLYIRGGTFNGSTTFTKTGGVDNHNNGAQNIFNSTLAVNQQSTTGYFMLGYNSNDQFNDNITVTNTGTRGISFGWSSGTGTPVLASGKTILVGGAGFSGGYLQLGTFTQLGNAAINLPFTGTSTNFTILGNSLIGGNLTVTAPEIYLNGAIFNGTVDATKTGANGQWSSGGNTFNGTSTFTNSSSSYFGLANGTADIYNGDVIANNTGSERLLFGNGAINLQFNGNITVSSASTAQGIQFSWGGTTTSTQAANKTITIGGSGYNGGYLIFERFTQLGNSPVTLNLASTSNYLRFGPSSSFLGNIISSSPGIFFHTSTFAGTVNSTKTGASNDWSYGGNTFSSVVTLTNTGAGYFGMENSAADVFNSDLYLINSGTERIILNNVPGGTNTFNGDIIVSQSGTGVGIALNWNGTAMGTIASGKTIRVGAAGFSCGYLYTQRITQLGNAAVNLPMTGTSSLYFGPGTLLGGNVTSTSGALFFNGCTFSGTVNSTKNGSTTDNSDGGNVFNGTTVITNNGGASGGTQFLMGNYNRDVFNAPATFNHNGDYRFYFAHNHSGQTTTFASDLTLNCNKAGTVTDGWGFFACEGTNTSLSVGGNMVLNVNGSYQSNCRFLNGNGTSATYNGNVTITNANTHASTSLQMGCNGTSAYNGNIIVSSTGNGASSGTYFNVNSTASSTLANTKTISLGAGGFVSGTLSLIRFTQIGSTAQSLVQTTGTAALILGPTSSFDANVTFNFPQVYLNGTTYNSIATITKNGATDNNGSGGNIFNGVTTINNSGSGYLMTGNVTRDQFNGSTTFNNTGSYRMYFAHNHTGQTTTFASDVTMNSAKSGGSDQWSFLICENNNVSVTFGGDVTINNSGTIRSDFRLLQGTGTTAAYNGNLALNITNTQTNTQLQMGTTGTSAYNGNITFVNTGAGASGGIFFNTSATASSTLASGKAMSLGAGGFTGGTLSLIRFTQLGTATQTLNQPTGTATIISGPTNIFNGDVNFNFPQIYLTSSTYNGATTLQKNGATDNDCVGGNTFNGVTSIANISPANRLRLANTTADTYNGNVTFTQNNAGVLAPNYNTNCTYAGNVTVNSTGTYTITFGTGGSGIATLSGSAAQTINKSGSAGFPVFTRLAVNKAAADVTLNTRINISSALTLTQGIVNTTQTNILNMNDNTSTTIGNSQSYINGPMNYDMALNGTRTLNMPVGKVNDWRPVVLTVNHTNATSYTYNSEVFNASAAALNWTKPATVDTVSYVHYWDINRYTTGTTTSIPSTNLGYSAGAYPLITLYFGTNDGVFQGPNLTIVKNTSAAPTTWIDIGGNSAIGTNPSAVAGSITSTSTPSPFNSFSRFTLGSKLTGTNPLPVEYVSFDAVPDNRQVDLSWTTAHENNSNYFAVEHSTDGSGFATIGTTDAVHYSNAYTHYSYIHTTPAEGMNYYRITEYDYNNATTVTSIKSVLFTHEGAVSFYPNPAKDVLHFDTPETMQVKAELLSTNGSKLAEFNFTGSANLDLKKYGLAEGLYLLKIQAADKIIVSKLVIE